VALTVLDEQTENSYQDCGDIPARSFVIRSDFFWTPNNIYRTTAREKSRERNGTTTFLTGFDGLLPAHEAQALGAQRYLDFRVFDLWAGSIRLAAEGAGPVPDFDVDPNTAMASQFWGHIDPPVVDSVVPSDSGYSTSSAQATVYFRVGHGGGLHYLNEVWRSDQPGSMRGSTIGQATQFTEPVPHQSTFSYRVRHSADPSPNLSSLSLARPQGEFSGWSTVSVPARISAYITGPDVVTGGIYSWDSNPGGGTPPPYHFRWYYQRNPYGPIELTSTSQSLGMHVVWEEDPYAFRLIVTVWDDHRFWSDSADMFLVYVEGSRGPGRAAGGAGVQHRASAGLGRPRWNVSATWNRAAAAAGPPVGDLALGGSFPPVRPAA
jgi:hypothetical protein